MGNNSGETGGLKGHPFKSRIKRRMARAHSRRSGLGKRTR